MTTDDTLIFTYPRKETAYDWFSDKPVRGYSLTEGELSVLADHWWDVVYDLDLFLTLSGCCGGAEQRDRNYAGRRLALLAELLAPEEFARVRDEVEARWKEQLSEETWTAFKGGRALSQEQARAEARRMDLPK